MGSYALDDGIRASVRTKIKLSGSATSDRWGCSGAGTAQGLAISKVVSLSSPDVKVFIDVWRTDPSFRSVRWIEPEVQKYSRSLSTNR